MLELWAWVCINFNTTSFVFQQIFLEHALAFHCPVPNGFFPHSNQHKFFRCVNGVNYEYDCPSDLVWNHSKGQCDWTPGPAVDVSKPAKPAHPEFTANREARLNCPTSDGFFPHPNAHKFFRCVRGIDYEYICPADLVWNQAKGQCDWSTHLQTPQLPNSHPEVSKFVCPHPNGYYAHPNNIHKFIQCLNGTPFEFNCPVSLIWNKKQLACDYLS